MKAALIFFALTSAALADSALNPDVTQDSVNSTICVSGYAATVRLSFWRSSRVKLEMLHAAGKSWFDARDYELDHIVPICLGGSPTDPSNLQLQPWPEARRKDRVEVQAMHCVCAGKATLAEAQHDLMTNWEAAYHKYAVMTCRTHPPP